MSVHAHPPDVRPGNWPEADLRRLRILSARRVTSQFAGEYRSAFRGRGIEFEEVREYQPGDDIRHIDWNVTARCGRPYIKQFIEEREMSVMLLLDLSASLDWPSPRPTKRRVAAEVCALLAYAAAHSQDRIGLLSFSDRIECYLPPAKGLRQAQRLIAESLRPPAGTGSDLAGALAYLERVRRRPGVLVLISDFRCGDFRSPLAAVARHHDVVAISVTDPLDLQLPQAGLLIVADPETGQRRLIDSGDAKVRRAYHEGARARQDALAQTLAAAGVEHLRIASDASPVRSLTHFFTSRRQRPTR